MLSYDLPYITAFMSRFSISKYIPILPQFRRGEFMAVSQELDCVEKPNHVPALDNDVTINSSGVCNQQCNNETLV